MLIRRGKVKKYPRYRNLASHISILHNSQELPNETGNVFIADSGKGDIDELGVIYVEPIWLDFETVVVKYDSLARVYQQEEDFNGIKIRYEKAKRGVVMSRGC